MKLLKFLLINIFIIYIQCEKNYKYYSKIAPITPNCYKTQGTKNQVFAPNMGMQITLNQNFESNNLGNGGGSNFKVVNDADDIVTVRIGENNVGTVEAKASKWFNGYLENKKTTKVKFIVGTTNIGQKVEHTASITTDINSFHNVHIRAKVDVTKFRQFVSCVFTAKDTNNKNIRIESDIRVERLGRNGLYLQDRTLCVTPRIENVNLGTQVVLSNILVYFSKNVQAEYWVQDIAKEEDYTFYVTPYFTSINIPNTTYVNPGYEMKVNGNFNLNYKYTCKLQIRSGAYETTQDSPAIYVESRQIACIVPPVGEIYNNGTVRVLGIVYEQSEECVFPVPDDGIISWKFDGFFGPSRLPTGSRAGATLVCVLAFITYVVLCIHTIFSYKDLYRHWSQNLPSHLKKRLEDDENSGDDEDEKALL